MNTLTELMDKVAKTIADKDLSPFAVGISDWGLYVTYAILGIAVLAIVFFAILQMVLNFKKALPVLIGIGIIAVIFLVISSLATGAPWQSPTNPDLHYTGEQIKWINTGMFTLYFFLGAAVLAMVYEATLSGLVRKIASTFKK